MALKTFNLDKEVYGEFSKHCKKHGISMSKKVENFIKQELKVIKSGNLKQEGFENPAEKEKEKRLDEQNPKLSVDYHPMGKYC